jgi:glutamate/tyrosine decarboxylase-like PLP-dependent enzyme
MAPPSPARPDSQPDPRPDPRPDPAARFGWHPEPALIGFDDPAHSRAALAELGTATWAAGLDYLYGQAFRRAMGEPAGYAALRRAFYGSAPDGSAAGPVAAPDEPTSSADLLAEFGARLAPHSLNAYHPRALSYFTPPPLLMSIVGEVLAQFINQGVDVWHAGPSSAFVEEEVGRWLCDLVGYGPESFAVLTSGGVMANFMALTVARDLHLAGVLGLDHPPRGRELEGVRVYASDQAHFSISRALDELGFPTDTLHVVAADESFRLRGPAVAAAIEADRAHGLRPFAICAVAGSTNTGAVDRTAELADLAKHEGLWLHVDAAYGGAARLSARDAGRVADLERADSITVDPHKWFFQAYDIGALVMRRGADLLATFHRSPEYYRGGEAEADAHDAGDGLGSSEPLNFYQRSMEGTRRFRALKLWLSWRHLGSRGLGRLVEANIDLAAYLARRIAEDDEFEALPAEPELSVVCFRHLPGGSEAAAKLDPEDLDAHQDALQVALEASGDGWLSTTRLRGRTYLRAGIVNFLTVESDIDRLLGDLRELAATT